MDFKIISLLIEDTPKFVKLVEDIEVLIKNTKDPHQKNLLLEIVDILEEITPRLQSVLRDLEEIG
ncbi:hypothetical protein HY04AAS1_0228 [Hydrogenobaculum sp. Y04AAS1]|uniref:hypothetical protein n=1 Tax=Hydrogenobaculum sp. (strain Y04AAS1) TaxID=380749 RepID=UPI00015BD053|nr:hypothetical protein HY04AAS1_0228 [Hydrogenobaculum sp. Y04AAS1]HCT66698.1 hypothetical protein [Hydrogenobaculum sp.]